MLLIHINGERYLMNVFEKKCFCSHLIEVWGAGWSLFQEIHVCTMYKWNTKNYTDAVWIPCVKNQKKTSVGCNYKSRESPNEFIARKEDLIKNLP